MRGQAAFTTNNPSRHCSSSVSWKVRIMNRVVITGMGWITPMGHAVETVWKRLLAGGSGIAQTTIFDAGTFPTRISAEVKGFNLDDHVPEADKHRRAGR